MPRRRDWDDEPGIVYDPEDDDWPDDDDEPTIPCPYCRRDVLEDADRCSYCEHFISREDAPPARKSWLIIVGVIACLCVVYMWNAPW